MHCEVIFRAFCTSLKLVTLCLFSGQVAKTVAVEQVYTLNQTMWNLFQICFRKEGSAVFTYESESETTGVIFMCSCSASEYTHKMHIQTKRPQACP